MSKRTLTDELRSVLLARALDAPQPEATVDAILARTVHTAGASPSVPTGGITAGTPSQLEQRRRRPSGQLLVAASVLAVLVLAVAGINLARHNSTVSSARSGSSADSGANSAQPASGLAQPGARGPKNAPGAPSDQPSVPPAPPSATPLDCSGIPGTHVISRAKASFLQSEAGEYRYVYEYLCVGANGQRSASAVQEFRSVGGQLVYLQTVVGQGEQRHVDFISGGIDSIQLQSTDYLSSITGRSGDIELTKVLLGDPSGGESSGPVTTVARVCRAGDLSATVRNIAAADSVGNAAHSVLALRNRTASPCALEGYPSVVPQATGKAVGPAAAQSLNGPAGGVVKAQIPPIIALTPGGTASAIVETGATGPGACPTVDHLKVTLPTGVSLGSVPAQLTACNLVVHPLVRNSSGTD